MLITVRTCHCTPARKITFGRNCSLCKQACSNHGVYVTHDAVEALALGDRIGVIREGRIVQTGTREEIWYRPHDTEVARAFGRPRINLLPGTVTGDGGFRSADGKVELSAKVPPGTDVLVGVRPRDIALNGQGLELTGTVYVAEVLGRAVEVTVRLGEQHVSLVAPRADTTGLRPDDPVRLTVRPENLLLFEADRPERPGRRIGKR
ncbi:MULTISPECIES: TOBE domain-containing protein [unclassified Streptomyces]|uniref:TOBE domain-containing protein n=1 Tax=unclassified Streptomyces TaxID=2593676 RepID=UPI0036E45429